MKKERLGYALTGSFCTFRRSIEQMKTLCSMGYEIYPVMSENAYTTDTRFGKAKDIAEEIEKIAGKSIIHTIVTAEPIGPRGLCDMMVVAPCTGNTLSKIALGVTDTPVTMAVKSQLRVNKPVVLCIATNDALSASAQNIGRLMNTKNIYLVPLKQDNPSDKPHSLVADFEKLPESIEAAFRGEQLQPVLI